MTSPANVSAPIHYPGDDGLPMSDNTEQFFWIQLLEGNLELLFRDRADVFVGGNLLWYPVQGFDLIRRAPDVFVVFGRSPGRRTSYLQWEENNIPFSVVIEVRSPSDSDKLMREKLEFYDEYGVTEYYMFDPGTPDLDDETIRLHPPRSQPHQLEVYVRRGGQLGSQRLVGGCFTSPLLGIRFDLSGDGLVIHLPNQRRFLTHAELEADRLAAEQQRETERKARIAADKAREVAEKAREVADKAREAAEKDRDAAVQRTKRLAELSRKLRLGQATPDELTELERLDTAEPT